MKKKLFLPILLTAISFSVNALDANLSFCTFKSATSGYVEIYLQVVGQTVEYKLLPDSSFQAKVEVVVLFKKDGEIVKFDKYLLNSPPSDTPVDFVDMKRYGLDDGEYELDVSVSDQNRLENSNRFTQSFSIDFNESRVYQSDIQLLASLRKVKEGQQDSPMAKGGYIFEPLPSHFYDKYCDRLIFYNEIYDTDKWMQGDFLVSYFLEKDSGKDNAKAIGLTHKRRSPQPIVPLLNQIDILELPSGNYNLVVEVKNKQGELLSRKSIAFQRSNPYLNSSREAIAAGTNSLGDEFVADLSIDELRYSLKAIAMQVDDTDGELMNTIIAEGKREAMELYLFSFWAREDPVNPHAAYLNYMEVAKAIDMKFKSGFGFGFETDRGYIYMKYGVPSDIASVEDEQSAPPYEIWFYNQFPQTAQNNVKFVFYNPGLSTNGFVLLHSTARGEINNPRWEVDLYSNAPNDLQGSNYIDGTRVQDNIGRQARRIFDSF